MGFFDRPLFDYDGDGKIDEFDTFIELQMTAASREEAIMRTGDDSFYPGTDSLHEDADLQYDMSMTDIDIEDFEEMEEEQRREALEDAGLDPDEYDDLDDFDF